MCSSFTGMKDPWCKMVSDVKLCPKHGKLNINGCWNSNRVIAGNWLVALLAQHKGMRIYSLCLLAQKIKKGKGSAHTLPNTLACLLCESEQVKCAHESVYVMQAGCNQRGEVSFNSECHAGSVSHTFSHQRRAKENRRMRGMRAKPQKKNVQEERKTDATLFFWRKA